MGDVRGRVNANPQSSDERLRGMSGIELPGRGPRSLAGALAQAGRDGADRAGRRTAPHRHRADARLVRSAEGAGSFPWPYVYWAGAPSKDTYELTRTTDGRTDIRYLPPGVAVGDTRPDYLTVGTYPLTNAYALVRTTAARSHVEPLRLADGGLGGFGLPPQEL